MGYGDEWWRQERDWVGGMADAKACWRREMSTRGCGLLKKSEMRGDDASPWREWDRRRLGP